MSDRTTRFGPRVSFRTTKVSGNVPGYVEIPSTFTFEAAGTNTLSGAITSIGANAWSGANTFSGALNSSSTFSQTGVFLSKATTASLTSATLADGELSIGSVSVTSATIYFRSGNTTYEFDAQASGVL